MEYQWRVTKYDPSKRNSDGSYAENEWVGVFELNHTFNAKTFTVNDYLETEEKYVNAAIRFFDETHEKSVILHDWHKDGTGNTDMMPFNLDISQDFKDGQSISRESLPLVMRMLLRNIAHCSIEIKDKFFIHIGWDFYMYVGSSTDLPDAVSEVRQTGLFVEPFISPYLEEM
jgi:hypothetical protein